jgi:hypothetical protein
MNVKTIIDLIKIVVAPPVKPALPGLNLSENDEKQKKEAAQYKSDLEDWFDSSIKIHRDERQDARKALDQNLLSLSSAALALTLTFISFIHGHIHNWQLLFWSCFFFVVTVTLTLFSYLLSEFISDKKIQDIENEYLRDLKALNLPHERVDMTERWQFTVWVRNFCIKMFPADLIDVLNAIAFGCFLSGLIILSFVCWSNFSQIQKGEKMEEKKPLFDTMPAKKPVGERRDEGLRPSNTKPKPLPPSPVLAPKPSPKPTDNK